MPAKTQWRLRIRKKGWCQRAPRRQKQEMGHCAPEIGPALRDETVVRSTVGTCNGKIRIARFAKYWPMDAARPAVRKGLDTRYPLNTKNSVTPVWPAIKSAAGTETQPRTSPRFTAAITCPIRTSPIAIPRSDSRSGRMTRARSRAGRAGSALDRAMPPTSAFRENACRATRIWRQGRYRLADLRMCAPSPTVEGRHPNNCRAGSARAKAGRRASLAPGSSPRLFRGRPAWPQ